MDIRILLPLAVALAALAVAAACGGDDDSASTTPTTQSSSTASVTPTPLLTDSAAPTPLSTTLSSPLIFLTPNRLLPPADHSAIGVFEVVAFYQQVLQGGTLTAIDCTSFDAVDGIIDCTAQGYGTIAVDPIPYGASSWQCRALLAPDGRFFAVSCFGGDPGQTPTSFIYAIQD